MPRRKQWTEVLRFAPNSANRALVRRHYAEYRHRRGLPVRCDEPKCRFHTEPLIWNEAMLPVILDHRSGVRHDNRPKNLRYLCPNCDSQLHTKGGANKGRVRNVSAGGYIIASRDGRLNHTLVIESAHIGVTGQTASGQMTKRNGDA